MKVERLTRTPSRIGRHLARVRADIQNAERLHGRQRETILRNAARGLMQAGFHDLARDIRQQSRGVKP